MKEKDINSYPCPACGFIIFDGPPGTYDICTICGWEDDHVQLMHPSMQGGANKKSLFEMQIEILKKYPLEIKKYDEYERDPEWRPLKIEETQKDRNIPQSGLQYFEKAGEESPDYYWKKV